MENQIKFFQRIYKALKYGILHKSTFWHSSKCLYFLRYSNVRFLSIIFCIDEDNWLWYLCAGLWIPPRQTRSWRRPSDSGTPYSPQLSIDIRKHTGDTPAPALYSIILLASMIYLIILKNVPKITLIYVLACYWSIFSRPPPTFKCMNIWPGHTCWRLSNQFSGSQAAFGTIVWA